MNSKNAAVVWYFQDGKPGHQNQILGLIEALQKETPISAHPVSVLSIREALLCLLKGTFPSVNLPRPLLIIGAGHQTHLSLLAAKRACGGRTIVLMRPALPLRFFDLCFIPEHDAAPNRNNVFKTQGTLNRVFNTQEAKADQGLFLIGGNSQHFKWNNEALLHQIKHIIHETPSTHWTLTTSRRTPESFVKILLKQNLNRFTLKQFKDTTPDWLPSILVKMSNVWVTPDSVSMVYEALTAGALVGVFSLEKKRQNTRVQNGLDKLIAKKQVQVYPEWQKTHKMHPVLLPFNESVRAAQWIVHQWLA